MRESRRRTKIVCTIGPASNSPQMIEKLVRAGMDCARLNFSHGTPEEHLAVINIVRRVSQRTGKLVAIMQDLPGPKLRVGMLKKGSLQLREGDTVTLVTDGKTKIEGASVIPVESENLPAYVKAGGKILLSDGSISLRIIDTTETSIKCRCEAGGILLPGKGVNIPELKKSFKTFTEQDKRFLAFGLDHGIDLVAVSFVREANDIGDVRKFTHERGHRPLLVAKIEKREAVRNISEIVEATDAVMVARGDLGVENPIEDVPQMQKSIIARCRLRGVPVITATQMLESMVNSHSPTRAEVTDIANAILDGTDTVMLSEETAQGKYPLECVAVLNRVALRTERAMLSGRPVELLEDVKSQGLADAFSESTSQLAQDIDASVVVIHSGNEAMIPKVSRFRSRTIIVHASEKEELLRRSKIVWGVYQCKAETLGAPDTPLDSSIQTLMGEKYLKAGDRAVFVREVGSSAVHARLTLSAVVVHGSSKGTTAG